MIDSKPFAAATKTSHNFIGNHHDAKLITQRSYPSHVPSWRNQNAISTNDGFEHDRGHRMGALNHQGVTQMRECTRGFFGLSCRIKR